MRARPVQMSLIVDDSRKAVEFYCATLGLFKPEGPTGTLRFLGEPSFRLLIVEAYSDGMASIVGKQAGDFPLLTVPVRSCSEMYAALKAAGVDFDRMTASSGDGDAICRIPWGEQLICFDPFGNRICLFEHYTDPEC